MSLFSKNAFTDIVDKATSETLVSENWDLNLQVCDLIHTRPDGPKDAMKAIKKRLLSSKTTKVSLLTLSLLESCVNNCGQRFYVHVVGKEFLPDFIKHLKSKGLDSNVKSKMLDLIQIWAIGLSADASTAAIKQEYHHLVSSGFQFPPRELDAISPIPTRSISTPVNPPAAIPLQSVQQPAFYQVAQPYPFASQPVIYQPTPVSSGGVILQPAGWMPQPQTVSFQPVGRPMQFPPQSQQPNPHPPQAAPSSGVVRNPEQELITMKEMVNLFAETLAYTDPTKENVELNPLIQEFHQQLTGARHRIGQLLETCTNERLIEQFLALSDDINTQLETYDTYVARYANIASQQLNLPVDSPIHSSNNYSVSSQQEYPTTTTTAIAAAAANTTAATTTTATTYPNTQSVSTAAPPAPPATEAALISFDDDIPVLTEDQVREIHQAFGIDAEQAQPAIPSASAMPTERPFQQTTTTSTAHSMNPFISFMDPIPPIVTNENNNSNSNNPASQHPQDTSDDFEQFALHRTSRSPSTAPPTFTSYTDPPSYPPSSSPNNVSATSTVTYPSIPSSSSSSSTTTTTVNDSNVTFF